MPKILKHTPFILWLSLWAFAAKAESMSPTTNPPLSATIQPSTTLLLPTEDHRTLPIQITKGYVFLEGKVKDRSGVFMVDTGTPFHVFLNQGYIPLKPIKYLSTGKAGSGQVLKVYEPEDVGPIGLAGSALQGFGPLRSTDFSFITDMKHGGIRPDFLGMAGLPLFRDYEFVLDYQAKSLDIYKIRPNGDPVVPHINPTEVVATLAIQYSIGILPAVGFAVDGIAIEGVFDTGALGDLMLTQDTLRKLERSGRLKHSGKGYVLDGLTYQNTALTADIPKLATGNKNSLKAGYNVFRHYHSVWNYKNQTITLLRK